MAQLVLDQPICALRGDRFILRDQSATRTIGGGFVLDPFAPATRARPDAQRRARSARHDAPETALSELCVRRRVIDLRRFEWCTT